MPHKIAVFFTGVLSANALVVGDVGTCALLGVISVLLLSMLPERN